MESLLFEFLSIHVPHTCEVDQIAPLDEKAIEISFFKIKFMKILLDQAFKIYQKT